jgi:hypothetical protein
MIEQPEAPRAPQHPHQASINQQSSPVQQSVQSPASTSSAAPSEIEILLREVKQLRQDVHFLKQLLEHVQSELR